MFYSVFLFLGREASEFLTTRAQSRPPRITQIPDFRRSKNLWLALEADAAKLPANDPLVARLRAASAAVDLLRKKIVATKEGGAITGEERLRENLAELYGNVNNYEGKPTQTQVERTDASSRELADVVRDFDAWMAKELPGIELRVDCETVGSNQSDHARGMGQTVTRSAQPRNVWMLRSPTGLFTSSDPDS